MSDSDGSALGAIIGFILIAIAVVVVVVAAVILFGTAGALWGSSIAVNNYRKAFANNVSMEKPSIR